MRSIRVHSHGGPEALEFDETDVPTPGPDELLIEIISAGINPVDTYFRSGAYTPVELPFTPGVDLSGEVVAIGERVNQFAVGDQVFGTGIGNGEYHGAYAEMATVPVDRVVHLPANVDAIAAGAAGVAGVTAWRALIDHGQLRPGDICLIHGGSGGVGHLAVQLATVAGAQVIATSSPTHVDRVTDIGADMVLPYDHPELEEAIEDRAPDGVDVILDHRLDEYLSLDTSVTGKGGRIVGIGEENPTLTMEGSTSARSKDVHLILMSMFNTPDLRVPLKRIGDLLAGGDLDVRVDRQYSLAEAAAAHESLFSESFAGKRTIVPADE